MIESQYYQEPPFKVLEKEDIDDLPPSQKRGVHGSIISNI